MPSLGSFLTIFQVGLVPIHAHTVGWDGYSVSSLGESLVFQDRNKGLYANSMRKTQPKNLTITLQLYHDGAFSANHFANSLTSQIGMVVPIIAYERATDNVEMRSGCCAKCGGCCPCSLIWLMTLGRITQVNAKASTDTNYAIEISLEMLDYWQPYNRFLWEWSNVDVLGNPYKTAEPTFGYYPSCDSVFRRHCSMFRKRLYGNTSFLYEDTYYTRIHSELAPNSVDTGYATPMSAVDAIHYIRPDVRYFNAPPMSIYLFDNLDSAAGIGEIQIKSQEIFDEETSLVSVDFSALSALALANAVALTPSDKLIVGEVANGARVIRNGDTILNAASVVTRNNGDFAGQLSPQRNRIETDISGTGARLGMIHTYRRI